MSRRLEILQRAQEEFQAAIERGRETREEVLRQRADVLTTHSAAAGAALAEFEEGLRQAFETFQAAIGSAQDALIAAEAEANDLQFQQESMASSNLQLANDAAALKRDEAKAEAERLFDEAFRGQAGVFGPQKDLAIATARSRQDQAVQTADRQFIKDSDVAFRAFQAAMSAAREEAITSFEKARAANARAGENAAAAQQRDIASVDRTLKKALTNDPTALAILEAFQLRLEQVDRDTEAAKADVLARMKADLKNATP